ncbi:MAG: DUF4003 family protein [Lachnospiraceae bacterium]|nr:DUF4003 family protein [Lachnospiraceae bacterium]
MKETTKKVAEKFARDFAAAKKAYAWDGSMAASTFALTRLSYETEVTVEKVKEMKTLMRKNCRGLFNVNLTSTRQMVAAVLAEETDPLAALEKISNDFKELRKITKGADYDAAAATLLYRNTKDGDVDAILRRTEEIYRGLKDEHPLLTSYDDIINCVMMALTEKETFDIVNESEECFKALKGKFYTKNNVQAIACILASFDGEVEGKCSKAVETYEKLRKHKVKFEYYGIPCVGSFAQVVRDEDFEDVVIEIKEVSEFLRKTKGLGNLYVGGGFRNLISVALVLSSYAKEVTESQTGTAINSIINTIIAVQMMAIACTVSTTAMITTSSSS